MRDPFAESPEFQRLVRGEGAVDLVRIGLEIARDAYPGLDPEPYLARVEALAARVRERCASIDRSKQVLGQINWVLYVEEGFQGDSDTYYDPRNSYLNEVLDRRVGIPITLSVLYWRLAERLGLDVSGLNLPAHFMLRVGRGEAAVFVDAFRSGALLDRDGCRRQVARALGREFVLTDDHLAACPPDLVVARMLRNLKSIYLHHHDYIAAIPVQRRLAALLAGDADELRDLGLLFLRADRPAEAVAPFEAYLDVHPSRPDAEHIGELLRAARRETALRN